MRVYVEVSKNHNMPISEVIRRKFDPEVKILIMYYNHIFRLEHQEMEKIKEENEKQLDTGGVVLNGG